MAQYSKVFADFRNQDRSNFEVMMLATVNGEVVTFENPLPVSIGSSSITINGDVTIPATISVASSEANPVHVHLSEVGSAGILTTSYLPIGIGTFDQHLSYLPVGLVTSTPLETQPINDDAFGRTQVSEPFTLGDYKHLYTIDYNFINKVVGAGSTVEFIKNQACATLKTGTGSTCYTAHQTRIYHNYQPGKSQLIYSSINFRNYNQNVTKRTGYFDDKNGIYLEQVGVSSGIGTMNFVIRSSVSGSVQERRVPQHQWNKNTLTNVGIGATNNSSGIELDITKTQLFWTDFQYLGVGRVRCGFVIDGNRITCHEYDNCNHIDTVYMSNPNLPVRCEIFNTGVGVGASMDQICSSVMSEGGYVESGIDWAVGVSSFRSTGTTGGVNLPVLAIRLKNSFKSEENRVLVKLNSVSVFADTKSISYSIIKLEDSSYLSTTAPGGLVWTSVDTDSAVEYCTNATSYIDGNILYGGYCSAGASQNAVSSSSITSGELTRSKKNYISQNFDSTSSQVYILSARTIETGNNVSANVIANIQWREIY